MVKLNPTSAALAQGLFYLVQGCWPLVSLRSFLSVTGPKTDIWLLKTVSVLITVIGGVLTLAGIRRQARPEMGLLGAGSALGLGAIDIVYVARRRISPVYLLDALAETLFILVWIAARRRRDPGHS